MFISTAITYWASDYAISVLKGDHDLVLEVFVLVCVTGPVLGIILGGAIVQKFAGGYEGKHSIHFCIAFAIGAVIFAIPIRLFDGTAVFGVCLWAILLFGGAIIPNVQGIMISSLKNNQKAAGNSVSNILQNLIGFLPAPFIYGFIYERTKDTDPKLAMCLTLFYSAVGVLFLILGMYYRNYKSGFKEEGAEEQVIEFQQVPKNQVENPVKLEVVNKRVSNN